MKGRMKGVVPAALIALGVGAVLGLVSALIVTGMAQVKTSTELYLADLETINLLYKSRNMQEYLKTGMKYMVPDYIAEGGPRFCGETGFGGRTVSVLKTGGCDFEVTDGLVLNESGRFAELQTKKYEDAWRVKASSSGRKFCLSSSAQLPFGPYSSRVCFESPGGSELREVLDAMKLSYTIRSECACQGEYNICWTGLGVFGENYNFTFAVEENC